ncbi:response regulator [Flavobacterium limi]|uniref:Response regulator n=1 Tax=Flavobacterium limi TaxID=2045105 RepID=A0ABQ1UYM1_9FLAO|nr:response regulator [Flavobacterium limi]GGF29513.1 response regulator [Flavobacterium limi]
MKYQYLFHIDDDEDDSEIFATAASEVSKTASIESFNDAHQALQKMELSPSSLPDVVFLDLNMPIMDGFQFLKEIKTKPHLKNIPVIILSTSSSRETIDKAKKMGAEGFITKPSDFNILVDILKSYLKK